MLSELSKTMDIFWARQQPRLVEAKVPIFASDARMIDFENTTN